MALDAGLPADEFGLGVVGQAVIPICEKHPADHQRNNAGGEGDYEIALQQYEESLEIAKELGDRAGAAINPGTGHRARNHGDI